MPETIYLNTSLRKLYELFLSQDQGKITKVEFCYKCEQMNAHPFDVYEQFKHLINCKVIFL